MAAPRAVLHVHGTTAERTAALRKALAAAPPLTSEEPIALAASDADAPAAFDVATYFSHLKARRAWPSTETRPTRERA